MGSYHDSDYYLYRERPGRLSIFFSTTRGSKQKIAIYNQKRNLIRTGLPNL